MSLFFVENTGALTIVRILLSFNMTILTAGYRND